MGGGGVDEEACAVCGRFGVLAGDWRLAGDFLLEVLASMQAAVLSCIFIPFLMTTAPQVRKENLK